MKVIGVELFPITLDFRQAFEESFGTVGSGEGDVLRWP